MKVYSYDFYWFEHLASTFKVRAQAFLFLCASRGLRRADLASGMSLALLSIVPGFLFPLGRGLEPLSRRPVFSARPPRAPLTKLDPGGVYGDFLSFPVLENQASTTSGLVHDGLRASSEVSSTAFVEMGRDGAPFSVDFVRKEVPGEIADISGFLVLSGLPFGEKWCDQNIFCRRAITRSR